MTIKVSKIALYIYFMIHVFHHIYKIYFLKYYRKENTPSDQWIYHRETICTNKEEDYW